MPKQTFFNLPPKKRQKLLDAIHAEFSRVPYDAVSINQIVRAAGISRGSFYQYFEDKQDVLQYLLGEYAAQALAGARRSLEASGGDLLRVFLDLLDFTYEFLTLEENNAFCRNVFADIRHNLEFLVPPHRQAQDAMLRELLTGVDKTRLDLQAPEDFEDMLGVLLPLTGQAFAQAFYDTGAYPEVRARFAARLELLRRGFYKDKVTAPATTEE